MFSIITPTYNRAEILARSLPYFFEMDGIENCQVIVVDDGSTDHTQKVLADYEMRYPGQFIGLRQENQGPGVARNLGITVAENDLVLFLDDDVFPERELLSSHLSFLNSGFDLSQGVLYWHSEIASDRVLQFMDRSGQQFVFDRVSNDKSLEFLYVYTANMALYKESLIKHGKFDEELAPKRYAFEDTGLAYNLQKAGLRLGLNRKAWAWHYHPMTKDQLVNRNRKVGYAYGVIEDGYPEIAGAMKLMKKIRLLTLQKMVLSQLTQYKKAESIFGWELFLRLRCREAFVSGLLEYRDNRPSV